MRFDQIQFRPGKKDKTHNLIRPLAKICGVSGETDVPGACLAELSASKIARTMIREAADNGWHIGLADLNRHDFHLDVPEKIILLHNNGMDEDMIFRSPYFRNALALSLIRALRDVWQEKRHGGFDEKYGPESTLMLERVRAADCDVMAALAAWDMREAGQDGLWRHLTGTTESDMALAFAAHLERNPESLSNGKAPAAAFRQWFRCEERVNACDHEALEYMDGVLESGDGASAFGTKRAGTPCVEILSCLPDKTAYLRGMGNDILRDPLFAGLADPINQSHFLQIMRDSQAVTVQGVSFRDAALAAKIFPDGNLEL